MKFAYLTISTWQGVAFGAVHYYGKLFFDDNEHELKHPLTKEEAQELRESRPDLYDRKFLRVKSGELFAGFWTKEEIPAFAIEKYKEIFPDAVGLILGSNMSGDPQPIIDGVPTFAKQVNKLVKKVEKLGRRAWETNETEMRKICSDFDNLMRKANALWLF
jgi:hypothetical protein